MNQISENFIYKKKSKIRVVFSVSKMQYPPKMAVFPTASCTVHFQVEM